MDLRTQVKKLDYLVIALALVGGVAYAQDKPKEPAKEPAPIALTAEQDVALTRLLILTQDRAEQVAKAQVVLDAALKAQADLQAEAQKWMERVTRPGYTLDVQKRALVPVKTAGK